MIDQIVFFQRKDHVKESSQHVVGVKFKQRSDASLQTPTNIYYKLTDLWSGATVLDWTSVSADDEIDITITATQNALRDQCRDYEVRELAVAANYGLADQFVDTVTYRLENTAAVT
jgi:hypothetical protein